MNESELEMDQSEKFEILMNRIFVEPEERRRLGFEAQNLAIIFRFSLPSDPKIYSESIKDVILCGGWIKNQVL